MKPIDFVKALGVAVAALLITMIASFPMVAFYAYLIEPGHPQEFYTEAAQWIAPWSSYILGPIVFFAFNYWLAKRSPERNAKVFAVTTIGFYVVVDFSLVPLMGADISMFLTLGMAFWLAIKLMGALLGAHMGNSKMATTSTGVDAT